MLAQTAKDVLERTVQLVGRSINGLANALRLMRNRNRLVSFQSRFDQATFVCASTFPAVLIAEVHFHAGNMLGEVSEGGLHHAFGPLGYLFGSFNVGICIDLDLHACVCLWWLLSAAHDYFLLDGPPDHSRECAISLR
jgi:hypothetical protein